MSTLTVRFSVLFLHMTREASPDLELFPTASASERLGWGVDPLFVPPAMLFLVFLGHHGKLAAFDWAAQRLNSFMSREVLRQTVGIGKGGIATGTSVSFGFRVFRFEMFANHGKLVER